MVDTSSGRALPGHLHELEIPPQRGYVVHTATYGPSRLPCWAWCVVSDDGPGYVDRTLTKHDGITPFLPDPANASVAVDWAMVMLGPVIFKVFC